MVSALKALHVGCVIASGAGFAARGALMLAASPLLQSRWARIAPHVIDTGLLASAVALALVLRLNPLQHTWLLVKIAALVGYIVIGSIALKRGRTRTQRGIAFMLALGLFAYIVGTALTRNARWVLGG